MFSKLLKKISLTAGALSLAGLVATSGAQANVISENFQSLGQKATSQNITWDFISGGGSSALAFELAGYASLDGYKNHDTDIFHLSLNGIEIFTGSFNLGGGGVNKILFNPNGATANTTTFQATDNVHNSRQVTWAGGVSQISLPVWLADGVNQIIFSYSGNAQGISDEAWGINQASLTTVPEPAAYTLLLAGLFGLAMARRNSIRKQ